MSERERETEREGGSVLRSRGEIYREYTVQGHELTIAIGSLCSRVRCGHAVSIHS